MLGTPKTLHVFNCIYSVLFSCCKQSTVKLVKDDTMDNQQVTNRCIIIIVVTSETTRETI